MSEQKLSPNTLRVLGSEPGIPSHLWPRFEQHAKDWEAELARLRTLEKLVGSLIELYENLGTWPDEFEAVRRYYATPDQPEEESHG